MKFRNPFVPLIFLSLTMALPAPRAFAVFKIAQPVSSRFAVSDSVIIGKVAALDPDHLVAEVTTVERLKDDASPAKFRLQFSNTPQFMKKIAVGQEVVLLAGDKASVHMADTWLNAVRKGEANPPIWKITQIDNNSAGKTFPGTTAAFASALREFKGGKSTLLDNFEGKLFTGGVKEIARLDVAGPTSLVSADINGDGKPDVIIATPTGVRLFLATADGFTDATEKWGLKGATGSCIAAGDVSGNGKTSLLVDGVVYVNDGQRLTAAPGAIKLENGGKVLAAALADFTGGKKNDAALFLSDGRLLVFKNDGQTASAWPKAVDRKPAIASDPVQSAAFGNFSGEGPGLVLVQEKAITLFPVTGEGSADFTRLTGDTLARTKGLSGGLKNALATPIDINGDHRPDLLLTADGANMILINRGFGTYLPDSDAGADLNAAVLKVIPASLSSIHVRAAISKGGNLPDDLLLLSDDGHLFLAGNSGAK
ncbi:MAG TPA: VCBS repeat-containing protein [Tepidisphaeraceae bacterium]|jgi:hypothetical protein|nr:VCBS repeat-containing protein [Tepidisphaeraceae bacterium]